MALDQTLRALNRYHCRRVLNILRRGPLSVSDIHRQLKQGSRASASQALALLLEAGIVSCHRHGRNNFYQLRPGPFRQPGIYTANWTRG